MAASRFVSYLRVSTARQGRSGLGLEAQRSAVADYLNGGNWRLVAEVVEIESGANDARPNSPKRLRCVAPTGRPWSSPNSTDWRVMPISCSAWKRLKSTSLLRTCLRPIE